MGFNQDLVAFSYSRVFPCIYRTNFGMTSIWDMTTSTDSFYLSLHELLLNVLKLFVVNTKVLLLHLEIFFRATHLVWRIWIGPKTVPTFSPPLAITNSFSVSSPKKNLSKYNKLLPEFVLCIIRECLNLSTSSQRSVAAWRRMVVTILSPQFQHDRGLARNCWRNR